jgi:hypothetical protein
VTTTSGCHNHNTVRGSGFRFYWPPRLAISFAASVSPERPFVKRADRYAGARVGTAAFAVGGCTSTNVDETNDVELGAFRDFLREQGGPTADDQELLAAKLMGRWRSGAPLVVAPDKDDPSLADDPQRNNNFNCAKMDPQGYAVPLGAIFAG